MAQTKVKLISDGVIDVNHLASGHSITTDNIGEGSRLYYTDARVSTYLSTNNYATEGYVTTAVANLVDSAPTTLDTLNELAAALGDDPNFATTVTNSIATKLPLAGGTISGTLEINRSGSYDTGTDRFLITHNENTRYKGFLRLQTPAGEPVLSLGTYNDPNTYDTLFLRKGNIGVGTDNPGTNLLSIRGYGAIDSNANQGLTLESNHYYDSGSKYRNNGYASIISQDTGGSLAGYIRFQQAGLNSSGSGAAMTLSDSMVIDESGNVGINTTSPDALLTLNGHMSVPFSFNLAVANGGYSRNNILSTGYNNSGDLKDFLILQAPGGSNAKIILGDSNHNIGIGVGDPTYKLDVVGFSRFNNGFYLQEATSGTNAAIFLDDSQRLRLQSFGASGAVRFDVGSSLTEAVIIGSDAQTTFYNNIRFGTADGVDWKIVGNANGPLIKFRRNSGSTDRYGILGWRDNGSGEYDAIKWRDQTVTMPGSVGIGTTAPEAKLHVSIADSGTDESRKEIQRWTHAGQNTMSVFAYGNTADTIQLGAFNGEQNISIVTDSYSNISKDNTKGIFIKSGGNVGIGTTSPDTKLHVTGGHFKLDNGVGDGYIQDSNGNNRFYWGTGTYINSPSTSGQISMYVGGSERLKINNGGDVGIGTTSPSTRLDVSSLGNFGLPATSGTTPVGFMRIGYTNRTWGGNEILFGIINDPAADYGGFIQCKLPTDYAYNRSLFLNPQGGSVAIGTTSPTATLDVNGSHRFRGDNYSEYTWNASGNYTSGTYYNIVDNFQGLLSGMYVIHCYVDTYAVGGAIYFMHFASVPFYWVNTATNNNSYQDLPQVLGTGHARNGVTPPSFRLQQTYGTSGSYMYLQFNPNANWSSMNGNSGQTFTVWLKRIGG